MDKVWNNLEITKSNKLTFNKIKISDNFTPIKDALLTFMYPTSTLGSNGNYFDPETLYIYEEGNPTQLKKGQIYTFKRNDVSIQFILGKIPVDSVMFYSDSVASKEEEEMEEKEIETGNSFILYKKITSDKCFIDKEQIRYSETVEPYEHIPNSSEISIGWGDWEDTGDKRQSSRPCVKDSCDCGSITNDKFEDGTLCDGVALCKRYELKYKTCDNKWLSYSPKLYVVGEVIDNESSNCGASELELREDGYLCSNCDKHKRLVYWLKEKSQSEWKKLDCPDLYVQGDLILQNSFSCCDRTKQEKEEEELCYEDAKAKYPTLSFQPYKKYKIRTTIKYIAPSEFNENYPEELRNKDGVEPIKWVEQSRTPAINSSTDSCECGYYTTKTEPTEVYKCGSELGSNYTPTTKYRQNLTYRYCDNVKIPVEGDEYHPPYTPEEHWVIAENESCECGYRITTSITVTGYTDRMFISEDDLKQASNNPQYIYVCGDNIGKTNGEMYYPINQVYYKKCKDGSNFEVTDTTTTYKSVSSSYNITEWSCVYDEETQANTTKEEIKFKTYYDNNESKDVKIYCNGQYITQPPIYTYKSIDCGYKEEWEIVDTGCCGYIEAMTGYTPITFTINSFSNEQDNYLWTRNGNTFTSPNNTKNIDSISAYCDVNLTVNKKCKLNVTYDQSSENGYDYFIVYSGSTILVNGQYKSQGTSGVTINGGSHTLRLLYRKDSSQTSGRDNAILSFSVEELERQCNEYTKYNIERRKFTVNYNDENPEWTYTDDYRYGSIIETNSSECGYIPRYTQWKLVCDDTITYETTDTGDTHTILTKDGTPIEVNCVICEYFTPEGGTRAIAMFAAEVKQYSDDYGKTWYVNSIPELRTERILRYKAGKCGYEGDIFQVVTDKKECIDGILYETQHQQVSSDDGESWSDIPNTTIIVEKGECQIEEGGE